MTEIVTAPVDITARDGVIDAFAYHPAGRGAWPAVLLFTDIRGVRPDFEATGWRALPKIRRLYDAISLLLSEIVARHSKTMSA